MSDADAEQDGSPEIIARRWPRFGDVFMHTDHRGTVTRKVIVSLRGGLDASGAPRATYNASDLISGAEDEDDVINVPGTLDIDGPHDVIGTLTHEEMAVAYARFMRPDDPESALETLGKMMEASQIESDATYQTLGFHDA